MRRLLSSTARPGQTAALSSSLREHPGGLAGQGHQQIEGTRRQIQSAAVDRDRPGSQVDFGLQREVSGGGTNRGHRPRTSLRDALHTV
jgi:hypothetical protein